MKEFHLLYVYALKWKMEGYTNCQTKFTGCNSSNGNWLITQYINKKADVTYAIEITVETHTRSITRECSLPCDYGLHIYYYPSNGPVANGAQLNTSNYIYAGEMVTSTALTLTSHVTFSLSSQFDRFYIAIEAKKICIEMFHVKVSYKLCPKKNVGLVVYPSTPIGASAANTSASCKANAIVSPNTSLSIVCKTNGAFSGSPECLCAGGYFSTGKACYGENSEHAVSLCTTACAKVH